MFKEVKPNTAVVLVLAIAGPAGYAGARVEGPLIASGLWEESRRSVVLEWQEYPNTVKVIHKDSTKIVCRNGEVLDGDWIRHGNGALIMLGVGTSDTGVGTSSLTVYSGDFNSRFMIDTRYETYGFGLSAAASRMTGTAAAVHSRTDATRIGDCPADMKPGETRKIDSAQ